MICFYHNDLDGKCAGAIVYLMFPKGRLYSINYNDEFPFEKIRSDDLVYIVDFSLQKPGDFDKLLEKTSAANVVWIDHHKTAIERHQQHVTLQGIRDVSKAGCVLTWQHFFPGTEPPEAVTYVGDRDTWQWKFGDKTKYFNIGLQMEDTKPTSEIWKRLLPRPGTDRFDSTWTVQKILKRGEVAAKYKEQFVKDYLAAWGFETTLEGYRCIALNVGMCGSEWFDSVKEKDYDLLMPFVFDGKQYTVSLYTHKEGIDCSELAKKYGGGGHVQAAGFQCKKLPFVGRS